MNDDKLVAKVAGAIAGRLNNEDRARSAIKEIERSGFLIVDKSEMEALHAAIAALKQDLQANQKAVV